MAASLADLERRRSALRAELARLTGVVPSAREELIEPGPDIEAFMPPSGVLGSRHEAIQAGAGVLSQALQRERGGRPWWQGLQREDLPVATDLEPLAAQIERLGLLRHPQFRLVPTEMVFPGASPQLRAEMGTVVGTGEPDITAPGELLTEGERLTDEEIRRVLEHLGMEEERFEGVGITAQGRPNRRPR